MTTSAVRELEHRTFTLVVPWPQGISNMRQARWKNFSIFSPCSVQHGCNSNDDFGQHFLAYSLSHSVVNLTSQLWYSACFACCCSLTDWLRAFTKIETCWSFFSSFRTKLHMDLKTSACILRSILAPPLFSENVALRAIPRWANSSNPMGIPNPSQSLSLN